MGFIPLIAIFQPRSDLCVMNKKVFLPLFLLSLLACKPTTIHEEKPEPPAPTAAVADSLHGRRDTAVKVPAVMEKKDEVSSSAHISDRICHPSFTLLAKPQKNRQIFYVSGFDQQEFKCWEEIQTHAKKICEGEACTIYYVDLADIKIIPTAPDFLAPEFLKEHGVGKFEFDGKSWELKGSSLWKRKGNGWSYYTTNNQFGG